MQVAFLTQCRKRDSEAEGVGANVVSVAVLVKKEVHESELLFLASAYQKGRDRSPSVGKAVGASKASVAVFTYA